MRVVLNGDIVEIRSKNCTESRFTKQNTMDTMKIVLTATTKLIICLYHTLKFFSKMC